jgi:hypothetical protein
MNEQVLRRRIRLWLMFFVAALVVSGLTAFPIRWEAELLNRFMGQGTFVEGLWPALAQWISFVHQGIIEVDGSYPFLFYGTDWLAFAHIVIALAFWGPLRDPTAHIWTVEWGMIACILLVPLALICGPVRGIPWFWQVADCSFGVFGIIPLWVVRRDILRLRELIAQRPATAQVAG